MIGGGGVPPGYERVRIRGAEIIARPSLLPLLRQIVVRTTLHDYAAAHPAASTMIGRVPVHAIPLGDDGDRIVVRHAQHGGALAGVTRDLFLRPRGIAELAIAVRLTERGVPTPEIVACVLYRAGIFRRSDIATREVERASDLAAALMARPEPGPRKLLWDATARLLVQLARAGARHPDLNLKNVLLAPGPTSRVQAWVLDVDRIVFGTAGDPAIMAANLERLQRSARKWRELHGAPIEDADLELLRAAVQREERLLDRQSLADRTRR